jgi:hypothetical protein
MSETHPPGQGWWVTQDPSGDVLPRLPRDDVIYGALDHAILGSQGALRLTRGNTAPDIPDSRFGKLGQPLRLTARIPLRMSRAPVASTGSVPAFGVTVCGVLLRGAFPQVPVAGTQDAVNLVEPRRLVTAAQPDVACVQGLHPRQQRPAESRFKREPVHPDHLECALNTAACRELAISVLCGRPGPQPALIRRAEPVNLEPVTFGIRHKLLNRHRRVHSFGVAGRGAEDTSLRHFTCAGRSR